MNFNYMTSLTLRIASGVERLDLQYRQNIAEFTRTFQTEDGGFAGRRGQGDIYYTSFALRTLMLLGELKNDLLAERAIAFLESFAAKRLQLAPSRGEELNLTADLENASAVKACFSLSSVELASFMISATLLQLATGRDVFDLLPLDRKSFVTASLARLRLPASGYRSSEKSGVAGIYHTFLAMICRELVMSIPDEKERNELAAFLSQHIREDGGFVEMLPLRTSGTNPTAAGVALMRILRQCDSQIAASFDSVRTKQFLLDRQSPTGGFSAHAGLPIPDLLSTFSAVVTLLDLDDWQSTDTIDIQSLDVFRHSCQFGNGYKGGSLDDTADVEYTFYGLALDSILRMQESFYS